MILASASPRRKQILEELGFEVSILPQDIDETRLDGEEPPQLVLRLAQLKARACAKQLESGGSEAGSEAESRADFCDTIVAADTIVWTDEGVVLGKPKDAEDARRMLRALSGKRHLVSTGVCSISQNDQGIYAKEDSFVETSEVEFFQLSEEEIDAYVASGEPLDKAGAYGVQGKGRLLVKAIYGDYYNVVGLPVAQLIRRIKHLSRAAN